MLSKNLFITIIIFITCVIFIQCQQENDSNSSISKTRDSLPPNLSKKFSFDYTNLLIFKEEQRLEIWSKNDSSTQFLKAIPIELINTAVGTRLNDFESRIPEGIFDSTSITISDSTIMITYPDDYHNLKSKIYPQSLTPFTLKLHSQKSINSIFISKENIDLFRPLFKVNSHKNLKIYIFPNDARISGTFPVCHRCPQWTEELYAQLLLHLFTFTTKN